MRWSSRNNPYSRISTNFWGRGSRNHGLANQPQARVTERDRSASWTPRLEGELERLQVLGFGPQTRRGMRTFPIPAGGAG